MRYCCLMYHDICAGPALKEFSVCEADFRLQISSLKSNGYFTLDLSQLKKFGYGMRPVLLTFDDGRVSNFEAGKFLSEQGLRAVFYVIKDKSLRSGNYLSENQIRILSNLGHNIGVHGKDHEWWTHKSEFQLMSEFSETKKWIEDLTGKVVNSCSAPGGFITKRIERLIRDKFPSVVYIRSSWPAYNKLSQQGMINAMAMTRGTSISEFLAMVRCDRSVAIKKGIPYALKWIGKRALYQF